MSSDTTGVIRADELYTVAEARRRLGLKDWAWRHARRKGLRTVKIGRAAFVRGSAILDFVDRQSDDVSKDSHQ